MSTYFKLVFFFIFILPGRTIAQFAPVSTLGTVSAYTSPATVKITVTNLVLIANCDLKILYDPVIAQATSVTAGPGVNGALNYNVSVPGQIVISWYRTPALTLANNSVMFNLVFSKVSTGTTLLTWYDDGNSCRWGDGNLNGLIDTPTENYYINGSLSFLSDAAPHAILPELSACNGTFVDVPVRVTNFINIGKVDLKIAYNPLICAWLSWTNNASFPGMSVSSPGSGIIIISGAVISGTSGITLPDSAILVTLQFFLQSSAGNLTFDDNGASCQFTGAPPQYFILNDQPFQNYYFNGSMTGIPWPAPAGVIVGPAGGIVCSGQNGVSFVVDPIANAIACQWLFPGGFNITGGLGTNMVTVSVDSTATGGSVSVAGVNGCGTGSSSPDFPVDVFHAPVILIQPVTPPSVISGKGVAVFETESAGDDLTYQWQEFVTGWNDISDGGVYSGTSTATLHISAPPLSMNGNHYRCRIIGFCPPDIFTDGQSTLLVSPPVGIDEKFFSQVNFNVYPNPANSFTKVEFCTPPGSEYTLTLTDVLGEKIFTFSGKNYATEPHCFSFPFTDFRNSVAFANIFIESDGRVFFSNRKIMTLK